MSDAEKRKWEDMDPEERDKNYLPQKFACLRRVPLYGNFVKERYDRCLDLYLCPRSLKRKMNIDRSVLLPQLPNISELRPFPTTQSMVFESQTDRVRSVQVDASGYYMATGGDAKECKREGELRYSAYHRDYYWTCDENVFISCGYPTDSLESFSIIE